MPEYSITIGGTEREVKMEGLDLARVSNGIDTMTCVVQSEEAAYRPAIRDEVLFNVDGTPTMGGIITSAEEMAWGGPALTDILTRISVSSFDIFAKYRYYTGTLAAGTLKSQLTTLVALLSSYGVTLHASQVNGPNVEALDLTRARLDNILTQLSETTGYVWFITADKELRMVDPSGESAPFDILDSGTVYQEGDIRVERTLDETYANRVILVINGAGPQTSTETFTAADGVSAGGYTKFTLKYPASTSLSDQIQGVLIVDGSFVSAVIGYGSTQLPTDSNWYLDYDVSPAQLVYPESSGQLFPDASSPAEVISYSYKIAFPYTVQADNLADQALYGIKEVIIPINQALTIEAAQALADSMVDSRAAVKTKVTYQTRTDGLEVNQAQTITVAKRNVDASFYITDVRMTHTAGDHNESMLYTVTATSQIAGNWRQTYKDWLGGGQSSSASGVVSSSGGGSTTAIGWPDTSVQFNRSGSLGGDADFTYNESASTVKVGSHTVNGGSASVLIGYGHTVN